MTKNLRNLVDVLQYFTRKAQIEYIYNLAIKNAITLDEFTKLTKWFWKGQYGLG